MENREWGYGTFPSHSLCFLSFQLSDNCQWDHLHHKIFAYIFGNHFLSKQAPLFPGGYVLDELNSNPQKSPLLY